MPAPTASLVFKWKPNAAQSNFNCGGNGDTVAGEEVHVVLYVVYEDGSVTGTGITHNYTKWQEVAGHPNQYAQSLGLAGAPPDPDDPCAPTPGPNQLVVAFDWWDVYPPRFHNGAYEVRASYSYTPAGGSTVTPPDVIINVIFDDALLTIAEPPSPKYFFWGPADPANSKVTVSFRVSDAQVFPQMTGNLKVCPLERAGGASPLRTQTMLVGVPITVPVDFTWDGRDDAGNVMPKGIYPYDLHIDDVAGVGSDVDDKVSKFLSIAAVSVELIALDEVTGTTTVRVGYALVDGDPRRDASQVKVEVYDPDFVKLAEVSAPPEKLITNPLGTSPANLLWHYLDVSHNSEKNGVYYYVVSAIDDHDIHEKGHRDKPALERGVKIEGTNEVIAIRFMDKTYWLYRKSSGSEIVTTDGASQPDVSIRVRQTPDGVTEYTTAAKNPPPTDADSFMWGSERSRGRLTCGEPRSPLFARLMFLKAGGCEFLTVQAYDDAGQQLLPNIRDDLPAKNQADILYYATHGHLPGGTLEILADGPDNSKTLIVATDINAPVNWTEDLEHFVIAGCSVLNIDSITGTYGTGDPRSANTGRNWAAMIKGGLYGGTNGIDTLLGYAGRAPLAASGGIQIAKDFSAALANPSIINYSQTADWDNWSAVASTSNIVNAWIYANLKSPKTPTGTRYGWGACAMDKTYYWWITTRRRGWLGKRVAVVKRVTPY